MARKEGGTGTGPTSDQASFSMPSSTSLWPLPLHAPLSFGEEKEERKGRHVSVSSSLLSIYFEEKVRREGKRKEKHVSVSSPSLLSAQGGGKNKQLWIGRRQATNKRKEEGRGWAQFPLVAAWDGLILVLPSITAMPSPPYRPPLPPPATAALPPLPNVGQCAAVLPSSPWSPDVDSHHSLRPLCFLSPRRTRRALRFWRPRALSCGTIFLFCHNGAVCARARDADISVAVKGGRAAVTPLLFALTQRCALFAATSLKLPTCHLPAPPLTSTLHFSSLVPFRQHTQRAPWPLSARWRALALCVRRARTFMYVWFAFIGLTLCLPARQR